MRKEPVFIGLDCSTHAAKALAWSVHGEPVAEAASPFPLSNPYPGWWEQNAQHWIDASHEALARVASIVQAPVAAIAITHQRETFVGVDHNLIPVRPAIVWMDERAHDDVAALGEKMDPKRFHAITGKPLSLTPSITKIHWIKRVEPSVFNRAHRWLDVQGLLLRHLAQEDRTSIGSADPMGLIDIAQGTWSLPLLQAVGVDSDCLPGLVESGSVVGTLGATSASLTGLPKGTPIVATAGDGQVAALGAGVLDLRLAYLNLGTAVVAGTVSRTLVVDRAFRTMSGAERSTYLFESDLKGGTFTLDWLLHRLLGSNKTLEELEKEAKTLPPGAGGLILVPYLATVMDPYWDDDASGVLFGLRGEHGPEHVFRAILEGIAFEQRLHFECIEGVTSSKLEEVRVLGGGASSALWCQILADVLERPVVRTRSREATSLGAAMLAAVATGTFNSPKEAVERMGGTGERFEPGPDQKQYGQLYQNVYRELYPALQGAMGKLANLTRSMIPKSS